MTRNDCCSYRWKRLERKSTRRRRGGAGDRRSESRGRACSRSGKRQRAPLRLEHGDNGKRNWLGKTTKGLKDTKMTESVLTDPSEVSQGKAQSKPRPKPKPLIIGAVIV